MSIQYGTYTPPRDWTDAYLDRHHMYTRANPPCTSASLRLFVVIFVAVVVVVVVVVAVHICRVFPPLVWRPSPRVIYDMYLEMRCTNYNHGRVVLAAPVWVYLAVVIARVTYLRYCTVWLARVDR
jgi:hypothetical protein